MASRTKNVYIDKLDDAVNKYNHVYHITSKNGECWYVIKDILKKINDADPNLKLVILLKYQNITFLQEALFQIGLKKFLRLKKIKTLNTVLWTLAILKAKKLLRCFTEKNCKKTNQKEFRNEKSNK